MFEYEYELEAGNDREHECEFASEYESEEFFPLLFPLLKAAAPMAIKAVGSLIGGQRRRRGQREFEFEYEYHPKEKEKSTRGQREFEFEYETSYENSYEGEYEGDPFIGNLLRGLGGALMGEGEYEYESEYESEYEYEAVPMSEYEMVMESLAYNAAHSESEAEAEAFLGALIPLAARLIPSAAKAITSVAPSLIQGVAKMGRTLYNNPNTRQLLQTVPTVLKGTVHTLANQVEQGKPLNKTTAVRALAANTAKVLDSPKKVANVMKKSHKVQHQAQKQMQPSANGKRRRTYA